MAEKPENTGSTKLAERLRAMRAGLTQQQAAMQADVNLRTWQNLEHAKTRAQPVTVQRIAKGFAVSFDDLWALVVDQRPLEERFTDEELNRLAARLAPMIAQHLDRQRD
jgi:transcriptional regulator with XRE-family HTH domain